MDLFSIQLGVWISPVIVAKIIRSSTLKNGLGSSLSNDVCIMSSVAKTDAIGVVVDVRFVDSVHEN